MASVARKSVVLLSLKKIKHPKKSRRCDWYTKPGGAPGYHDITHHWEYPWHNYRRCQDQGCTRTEWYWNCMRSWQPDRPYDLLFSAHNEQPPNRES